MKIRKSMMIMLCLFMPCLGIAGQVVTLDQTLHFKWKGLPVATVDFNVALPHPDHQAIVSSNRSVSATAPSVWPKTLIEVTGKTRGPLRLFEEYQATVEYVQLDANGKNLMTLVGLDNGVPEQREVLFAPKVIPEVSIFEDSTAKHALEPQSTWAQDT